MASYGGVTVDGFHHGHVLHLVLNCLAIASMGSLLEPRMGRLRYAAFFPTATTISGIPDCLLSNTAIGLSGGSGAMFGLLLVLRRHDQSIADIVPPSFAIIGFVWLFLCMVLTFFDILAITNVAHVAGVIYGLLAGQVFYGYGQPTARRRWKLSFFATHLLLLPAFYLVMHPFWIGSYHWYRARSEENPQSKVALLEQAVTRDPSLEIPWCQLANYYATTGDRHRGWKTILRGLDYDRSDEMRCFHRTANLVNLKWTPKTVSLVKVESPGSTVVQEGGSHGQETEAACGGVQGEGGVDCRSQSENDE